MEGGENDEGRAGEDVTVTLPVTEGAHLSTHMILDSPEPWEETTQIEEPWSPGSRESLPLSRLALPPIIDELDDDENELTDYALVVEPTTVTAKVDRSTTPPLVPRGPLPPALTFRTNLGTTPPPRLARSEHAPRVETPQIAWHTPSPEEEMVRKIDLDPRKRISPVELERVTLRGPAPVPVPSTGRAPQQPRAGTHAAFQHHQPQTSLHTEPTKRSGLIAFVLGGMATGVVGALMFLGGTSESEGESKAEVPRGEIQTQVVSVPILIPISPTAEEVALNSSEEPQEEVLPGLGQYRGAAGRHFDSGLEQLAKDELAAAEHSFRRAMRADSNFDAPIRALGQVFERSGNERQAIHWYSRYLKRVPSGAHTSDVRQRVQILRRHLRASN